MKAYILFQTDTHYTTRSRVCCGVFSTKEKAIEAAKENDLYHHNAEVLVLEATIDIFEEV